MAKKTWKHIKSSASDTNCSLYHLNVLDKWLSPDIGYGTKGNCGQIEASISFQISIFSSSLIFTNARSTKYLFHSTQHCPWYENVQQQFPGFLTWFNTDTITKDIYILKMASRPLGHPSSTYIYWLKPVMGQHNGWGYTVLFKFKAYISPYLLQVEGFIKLFWMLDHY